MKNWKMIFRILFEHLILRLADNRGEGLPIDLGKFYRDENGVLYYENSEKILKITSRYVEKLKDTAPTLKRGKINCVVVKDLSRLGRNDVEANRYYEDVFLANHHRFIAIDDNVDTLRGYEQHATFKNMFNSMYPRDISQKTHSAYMTLALNGDRVSRAPYGLKKDPENNYHLIIDDEVANEWLCAVRTVFKHIR